MNNIKLLFRMSFLKFGLSTLLVSLLSFPANAQTIGPERVLVRNVVLFDPSGAAEDRVVNILLRDNKLDLVTEDKISRDEADMVVNANKGILLGKLAIGEKPSFLVFNEDPRENFDVMMDTFTYSVFAVDDGVVVKNRLLGVVADEPEDEPEKTGWLAYTPPPFMVPLNYQDASKWNQFETKYINGIFVSAMVLDRMNWLSQDQNSEDQWGDLDFYDGGEIRGFRFGFVGTLNFEKPWIYTVFAATHAFDKGFEVKDDDDLTFFDYRLDIPFFKNSVMSIGKQKEPISMERLTGGTFLWNQERAAISDALMPSRNIGVVWNGSSPEKYSSWAFGVFNNWLEEKNSFDESATQYVSRLAWAPLRSADDSNLLHLGFGYRYSDAKEGFRYATEPEFNKAPDFVDTGFGTDTGVLPADKTQTFNFELAWRRGPTTLHSEYTRSDVDNPALGNPSFDGYFVTASWILTGEMRAYNKKSGVFGGIPVAKSVYQNGKGSWELYARYSDLDFDDGAISGGKMQIAALGLNWWLTPFFSVNAGYKYIWNEMEGMQAESSGLMTRLILVLE
jgi:phosphate-selective porin OprO/OprP